MGIFKKEIKKVSKEKENEILNSRELLKKRLRENWNGKDISRNSYNATDGSNQSFYEEIERVGEDRLVVRTIVKEEGKADRLLLESIEKDNTYIRYEEDEKGKGSLFLTTHDDSVMEIDAKSKSAKKIIKAIGQFSLDMQSSSSKDQGPVSE